MTKEVKESINPEINLDGKKFKVVEIFQTSKDITFYDQCNAACPICITYSCTMNQGHYSKHRCQEGHSWL